MNVSHLQTQMVSAFGQARSKVDSTAAAASETTITFVRAHLNKDIQSYKNMSRKYYGFLIYGW